MVPITLSPDEVRLLRMQSQQLLVDPPMRSPDDALAEVFCLQAQELPSAILSLRPRSKNLTNKQIETARKDEKSIHWTWSLRGTLHLITTQDARWLIPLLGSDYIARGLPRMKQLGWNDNMAAKAIDLLTSELAIKAEMTRPEIRKFLKENGFPFEGQAPTHLLYRAVFSGRICSGKGIGKQPTFMLADSLLQPFQDLPRFDAVTYLFRRYLHAYGPALVDDFCSWSGIRISEAKKIFESLRDSLFEINIANQSLWMLGYPENLMNAARHEAPVIKMLPRYDTYLMGYANRDLLIDRAMKTRLIPGNNGVINASIVEDGWVSGTWKIVRTRKQVEIHVFPFSDILPRNKELIEVEVEDIGRFLGEDTSLVFHPSG